MRAFSSTGRVSGVKRLAVLGGDYKTGAMNLSSPRPGGAGVTAGRERSASPVGGPSSTFSGRSAFPSVWIRPDIAPHRASCQGGPNTRSAEREVGVGAGREGEEAGGLCDVWAHDPTITQPQSLREPQLMTTRPLLTYKWCRGRLLKLLR